MKLMVANNPRLNHNMLAMDVPTYTPRQVQVLEFIQQFIEKNGYSPTYSEIGDEFGVASVTAWETVNNLIKKRALDKKKHDSRGIYIKDVNYQPVPKIRNQILALVQRGDQEFIEFLLETADGIREGQQKPAHSESSS